MPPARLYVLEREMEKRMRPSMLDDEHAPFYTVGQVALMLDVQQALLRRIDEQQVVSPQRSAGGQRRYSRHDIGRVQRVVIMMGEGMTLPAIRRIIELEGQLTEVLRDRDELARRLAGVLRERDELARQLAMFQRDGRA
jgi:MerR family transcriptional regulator, heat shock protein HspR